VTNRGDFHYDLPAGESRPHLQEVYEGFGAKLPGPTQFLMDLSEIVKKFFLVLSLGAGAAIWGLVAFHQNRAGTRLLGCPAASSCDFRPYCA